LQQYQRVVKNIAYTCRLVSTWGKGVFRHFPIASPTMNSIPVAVQRLLLKTMDGDNLIL